MKQFPQPSSCPYCNSIIFHKHGTDKNVQRYRCKTCKRTFRATTGTALHWIHKKDHVKKYLSTMQKNMSIRKSAIATGISTGTSFSWRHKLLSALPQKKIINTYTDKFAVQLLKIPYSCKGQKHNMDIKKPASKSLLIQQGNQILLYKISDTKTTKEAAEVLRRIIQDKIYVFQPNKFISAALRRIDGKKLIRSKEIAESRKELLLKEDTILKWLDRFQGVATKYLQHYWNWYAILENTSQFEYSEEIMMKYCFSSHTISEYKKLRKAKD